MSFMPTDDDKSGESRRQFIRKFGATIFAITVVDLADHAAPGVVRAADVPCGSGNPDGACGSGTKDQNCQAGSDYDVDNNCGQPASGPKGDPDEGCSPSSASGGNNDNDNNCSVSQVPNNSHDTDQHCTKGSFDADQSCGDCDDDHDPDEHCGQPTLQGGVDTDELCGHQSGCAYNVDIYGTTQDQVCGTGSPPASDGGCGSHKTVYGGSGPDPDQHCDPMNNVADLDCSKLAADSNCNAATNPSTTSPDEKCSGTDEDSACGHYDADESCNSTVNGKATEDESCGTISSSVKTWSDPDGHCPSGKSDTDNTGLPNT